jgi:hypothetical protein
VAGISTPYIIQDVMVIASDHVIVDKEVVSFPPHHCYSPLEFFSIQKSSEH